MKKSDNPDVLFGRDFDEEASPIEELEGEVGQVVIRGKILTCELRELRSGNTLFMFSVTDFTDTIGVKIFAREDTLDDLKTATKAGQFVRIKGVANIDKFDGELTIGSVSGIKKCEDFVPNSGAWTRSLSPTTAVCRRFRMRTMRLIRAKTSRSSTVLRAISSMI